MPLLVDSGGGADRRRGPEQCDIVGRLAHFDKRRRTIADGRSGNARCASQARGQRRSGKARGASIATIGAGLRKHRTTRNMHASGRSAPPRYAAPVSHSTRDRLPEPLRRDARRAPFMHRMGFA